MTAAADQPEGFNESRPEFNENAKKFDETHGEFNENRWEFNKSLYSDILSASLAGPARKSFLCLNRRLLIGTKTTDYEKYNAFTEKKGHILSSWR